MNYTSLHHRPEVPDCRRTLSGQGRIFVYSGTVSLTVKPFQLGGFNWDRFFSTPPSKSHDRDSGRHHNDHRRRNPNRNRNRNRPFYSPTGETYRNNNIVANTAKAVKGVAQNIKKLNGNATDKKIKSYFIGAASTFQYTPTPTTTRLPYQSRKYKIANPSKRS